MDGIKVVELGFWVAGPAIGGILADWGADVVKIEPLDGDPFRSLAWFFGMDGDNPPFELDNRSKRSMAIDYSTDAGREILLELIDDADVFVTNLRPGGLERAGFDYETLGPRCPRLVYASVTGYGLQGPDRDRPAYDVGAFWARAGIAAALTPDGTHLPLQRGGMGDHMTAMSAVAAISAALYRRELTGQGQQVRASLLRLGMYMVGWDTNINLRTGMETVPYQPTAPPNPLIHPYRSSDGRSFWMLGLESDRHWERTCRALGHVEWVDDSRFTTIEDRLVNTTALTALLRDAIAGWPFAELTAVFDEHDVWWAPVQATHEAVHDPQALANGALVDVPVGDGSACPMVASPVDFDGTPWAVRDMAPELGQHTEMILMEMGRDWDEIEALKAAGVIN
jgi:crotonobetainyl-CoA:carnitine CoA-transferase CaiB-like acyl-CoA transferase